MKRLGLPRPVFAPCGLRRGSLRRDGLAEQKQAQPAKAGGARRDRTADLVIANDALSQLSYGPLRDRLDVRDDGQQSAPFTIRAKVKSRTAKSPFARHLSGTSLVCQRGNRYLAASK